jgi:hypothetical protein
VVVAEWQRRLFIDQPVGVGFSYGRTTVGTSEEAAADVWKFLQIWFEDSRFRKYASREFGIWTVSYGGHYGPTFAACVPLTWYFSPLTASAYSYFLEKNDAIRCGTATGVHINLKVLGIGDGLTVLCSGMSFWSTGC